MIPILFNKDEKTFTSLGLGQMDATLVEVERERNGNYTLYAEVPFNSPQAKHLTKEMLIKADAGARTKWQTFKINRTIKDTNADVIKVYADHISMDTINDAMNPKVVIRQQTAEGALRQWANSLVSGKAYDVQSDITHVGSTEWTIDEVENARQALGGVQGSILDVWGGEYEFDNNTIILHKEMGRTAPTVLEYGRNIVSLEYEELIDGVYTSIYPYATYTPKSEDNKQLPDIMVTLDELIVDSEYADNYETKRIQIVDFSNEFDSNAENPEIPTQAKLRTLAKAYVKNNGYGIPKISQEIDFVDLSKTLDYQDIQVMEEIELNDRVPVYYPNIDAETNDVKVTTTNWDVLNNRYSKITLSTIGAMNTNSITSKLNTAIKDLKAEQKKINNTVPYLINGQGNRVWHTTPDDNMEHKLGDTWFKKNGKYTIIYKWNGPMWEEVLNDETFITEIEAGVNTAIEEVEKAVQATQEADAKAQDALEKAGANASLLTTHQNTLNTINNTTIPNINSAISDARSEASSALNSASSAMSEAKTALSSASSAMDEAKKADGKIADYVTRNGLVNGTTVDSKIDEATGEISKKITTVESKIPTELGGRNYLTGTSDEWLSSNQGQLWWTPLHSRLSVSEVDGKAGDSFTASVNLRPTGDKGVFIRLTIYNPTASSLGYRVITGNEIAPGEEGISTVTVELDENDTEIAVGVQHRDSDRVSTTFDYKELQLEKGSILTDWTPAPEDNYTKEEFSIFESTYNEDVKGINSSLTELSNKKLDSTTYTNFYNNDYKITAQGVTDTWTAVNKVIDANGNSTDAFAKAVYDRNATRQSADFKSVTDGLVKTATYEDGINGINNSISSVEGKIPTRIGTRNYFVNYTATKGKLLAWASGAPSNETDSLLSDFISVSAGDKFVSNEPLSQVAFYDANKNYLGALTANGTLSKTSGSTFREFEVPTGQSIGLMRVTVRNGYMKGITIADVRLMLTKGDVVSDWELSPEDREVGGNNIIKNSQNLTSSNNGSATLNIALEFEEPLVSGEIYTISFDIKSDSPTNSNRLFLTSSMIIYRDIPFTTDWKRHSFTFVYDGSNYGGYQIRPHLYPNSSISSYVRYVRVEKGMVGNAWGVSPQDIVSNSDYKVFKNDYAETAESVSRILTAIDSTKQGSVAYNANTALSTAQGNTSSITSLNTKVDNIRVGGRNLLEDTHAELKPYTKSSWDFNVQRIDSSKLEFYGIKAGTKLTYRVYIDNPSEGAMAHIQFVKKPIAYEQYYGNSIPAGGSGYSTFTIEVTNNDLKNLDYIQIAVRGTASTQTANLAKKKLEIGSVPTDWSPAPEDMLGKETFTLFKNDYEETAESIESRLTAIDSGNQGSVLYNANEALSTAKGNTSSITTLNTKVDNYPKSLQNLIQSATSELVEETIGQWGNITKWTVPLSSITSSQVTYSAYLQTNNNNDPLNLRLELFNTKTGAYKVLGTTSFSRPQGNGRKSFTVSLGSTSGYDAIRGRISPYNASNDYGYKGSYGQETLHMGNKDLGWHEPLALGKDTFTLFKNDYEETSKGILSRLTAIDSSAEGSVVTRLNATEKTADENKNTISKVNNIVTIQDTRNTNQSPKWYRDNYPKTTVQEFKTVTAIRDSNIPSTSGYGILSTTIVWNHTSGGTIQQVFTQNDKRYTRRGWTDDTGWSPWVKMTDQEDIKNFVSSTSTEYQTITERSNLYERVIGSSTEAGMKQNISRIVMTDSAFQTEVVDRQNLLTAMASGTGMTSDPYFNKGTNGLSVYDNGSTGTITIKHTKIPSTTSIPAPKGNDGYRLDITHSASSATAPNRGGIVNSTMSWANGTVVIKFVALLPTGRSFSYNNNGLGTGYTDGWLTDNKGTGKWETYAYYYRFGSGGTFSSFGHLSVTGSTSAFSWYLSEYDIINVAETTASKITQLADNINLKVSKGDISNQININTQGVVISGEKISLSGNTSVDGAFWTKQVNAVKVNASNITTGTLDASKVTVSNLDANNITGNKSSFVRSVWNSLESSIRIDGGGLLSKASDNSQVYLQNGVVGARNPDGATVGQIGYAYETSSPWYSMQISNGSHFQIRMSRGAGELNKQAFYIISGGRESYLNTDDIYLNPVNWATVQGRFRTQGETRIDAELFVAERLNFSKYGGYIRSQSNSNMQIYASNNLVVYAKGSNALEIDGTHAVFRRQISENSDMRLKTNIVDMPIDSLEAIRNLEIKKFDYLDGRLNQYGIIAQQAQNYLPELIDVDSEGYLMVNKSAMTYINMHAIQQLDSKVDDKVEQLEAKIATLQKELATLKGD